MMTDAEINLAIAKLEYPDYKIESWIGRAAVVPAGHPSIRGIDYMQWCWIGPIIEREKLTLGCNDTHKTYFAHDGYGNFTAHAETPTKAAALCYLKMKGVQL